MFSTLNIVNNIKSQFTTKSIVLIPIAVGINLVGGTLCSLLKLPLFIDTIGTVLIAGLAGPWVAAACGLLTNLFLSIVANPVYLPYAAASMLVGFITGYLAKFGLLASLKGTVIIWLTSSLVNTISASVITLFIFGGSTGLNTGSIFTAALIASTKEILLSVLSSSMIENLVDKGIVFLISYNLLKNVPLKFLNQYSID